MPASVTAATVLPKLIQRASEGPEAVVAALKPDLEALGFTHTRTRGEPAAHLFVRGASPNLVLSGHVDVVPVGAGWTRDPWAGETDQGAIWGRGACDMLGGIACFVAAAARAADLPLAILLTTDEETGMHAAEHAVNEGMLAGVTTCVVGEPTDLKVGIAEKGVWWVRLETAGVNAHGSMPHLGENAATRLVRALARLEGYQPRGQHSLLGSATANLARLQAGEATNQVPAAAWAELDVRYLPGSTSEGLAADLCRLVADDDVRLVTVSDHAPFETAEASPVVQAALRVLGGRGVGLPYGTEASKFAPAGLDCVVLGPGDLGLAHTNRERVPLQHLLTCTDAYEAIVRAQVAEPAA